MRNIFTTKKQQNRPGQKTRILSMAVILSLVLTMLPVNGVLAAEQNRFTDPANANHWGRSDLRAYLNNGLATVAANGTVSNKNYGLNSAAGAYASSNASGYAAEFSAAEYALVQPFTYSTNVFNGDEVSTYTTTDKFWLPSANHKEGQNQILSWGSEDISSDTQYTKTTANDKQRIIPISYWSKHTSEHTSMLRSPYSSGDSVLTAERGDSVKNSTVNTSQAVAAAFKIDLSSVNFASVASAASIIADVTGGTETVKKTENAKKIEISGSEDFGKKTADGLIEYGMYLKTSSDSSFTANSLSLSGGTLTVDYTGGVAGQYVVVHVFKADDLANGTTNFVAAKELGENGTSETMSAAIDVSQWGLNSLDGYTIKVWMEDGSGSLAKATEPVTFVDGNLSSDPDSGSLNPRVFAMKADLQTSWGDLSKLSDEAFNKVVSGNSVYGGVMGTNPTNQKLYFGSRQFWIAGRETAANDGEISENGNIMTLYQVKPGADDAKAFNASTAGYLGTPTAGDFAFTEPDSLTCDGTAKKATVTSNKTGMGEITIKYYKADGTTPAAGTDATAAPTEAGKYIVKIDVAEGLYDAATDLSDADWTFTIEPASSTEPASGDSDKGNGSSSSGTSGSPGKSPETGDEMSYYTMLGLGVLMMLALGFMPNVIRNRKKLKE